MKDRKTQEMEWQKATFILSKCINCSVVNYVNLIYLFLCEKVFLRDSLNQSSCTGMSQEIDETRCLNRRK